MKRQIVLLLGFCLLLPGMANAQKKASQQKQNVIQVEGSATYAVGENEAITLCDARDKCILKAKVDAIKNKFGERITVHEEELNENYFRQVQSECKAEWLKDVGKPVLSASYQDGVLTFTAEVKGMIREIQTTPIDIKYTILTNGRRETDVFNVGERLMLRFSSPADGYVAVYLLDDISDDASRILPYNASEDGYSIRRNKEYIFFDKDEDKAATEYKMNLANSDNEVEKNRLVIIFSKKPIPPCEAVVDMKNIIDHTNIATFNSWLFRCQNNDAGMEVRRDMITIQKNNKEQ